MTNAEFDYAELLPELLRQARPPTVPGAPDAASAPILGLLGLLAPMFADFESVIDELPDLAAV